MADGHNLWSSGGYSVNNPSAWGPPQPPTSVSMSALPPPRFELRPPKRPHSESDDCDDAFSEGSSKDRCSSPADDCQMGFSRKKRRGIIEKRRRDRINSSLSELRRLVPSAFEKQGSAKLEKAEILQMTVDHLKSIHSKGLDTLAYDPHKFAMDYHNIGFRECAAEVARYLVTVEGMDIQDPLRLRLMSHLQCFAAQREIASKQPSTPWNYNNYPTTIHDYPNNSYDISPANQHHQSVPGHLIPSIPATSHLPPQHTANRLGQTPHQSDNRHNVGSAEHHQGNLSPSRQLDSPRTAQSGYPSSHHLYPPGAGFQQQGYNTSGQVKPYRPWGAEVAY